jgi:hypothetical protein
MTRSALSTEHRFFLEPTEAASLLWQCLEGSEARVYHQLFLPGIVLEPVDATSLSSKIAGDRSPPVLHVTHQELDPGPTPGTFAGGLQGVICVWLPRVEGDQIQLGRVAANLRPEQPGDAALAELLVKRFRKAAPPGRLVARSLRDGATGPARGVGCSDGMLEAVRRRELQLRQWGVGFVDYVPLG